MQTQEDPPTFPRWGCAAREPAADSCDTTTARARVKGGTEQVSAKLPGTRQAIFTDAGANH